MESSSRQGGEPAGRLDRMLLVAAMGLLAILGIIIGWRQIISPDLGFHLALGRWIVAHGWVPATDPLTYTVPDHASIDLQWLSELLAYGMYRWGGTALIVASTIAATFVFSALLMFRSYRREGRIPRSGVLLLLLFFLGNWWEPRPHVLSWIFGSLVLLILEEHGRGSKRWLVFLPPVMLLWVNIHSLFILGPVVIVSYVFSHLLTSRFQSRLVDKRLLFWCGAAILACLFNPYHVRGLLFPFEQVQSIQNAGVFKSTQVGTVEFVSPFTFGQYFMDGHFVLFQPWLFMQLAIVLVFVGWIGLRRRWRLFDLILLAGFTYAFYLAAKNFGYFAMAVFPLAACGIDRTAGGVTRWVGRIRASRVEPSGARSSALWLGGCCALCTLLIVMAATGWLRAISWGNDHWGGGFDESATAVGACRFIETHQIRGRLLNSWNDGGYIAWATGQKVFIYSNGDFMGPAFYGEYVESREPKGLAAALSKWKPTVAVVPFKLIPYWLFYLNRAKDWRMVYADDYAALFLHASVAPEIPALGEPKAGEDYPVYDAQQVERIVRTAASAQPRGLIGWLQGSSGYPLRQITRAGFDLQTGRVDACIGTCLQGLDRTPFLVPDLLLTLGHALNARRQYELADVCFDAFMRADDEPVIAHEIQRVRRSRR